MDGLFLGSAVNLYGIAAVSSTNVWVVGYAWNGPLGFDDHPITEHWDGTDWALVSPPGSGGAAELFSATTVGGSLWAVGAYSTTAGIELSNAMTVSLKR